MDGAESSTVGCVVQESVSGVSKHFSKTPMGTLKTIINKFKFDGLPLSSINVAYHSGTSNLGPIFPNFSNSMDIT